MDWISLVCSTEAFDALNEVTVMCPTTRISFRFEAKTELLSSQLATSITFQHFQTPPSLSLDQSTFPVPQFLLKDNIYPQPCRILSSTTDAMIFEAETLVNGMPLFGNSRLSFGHNAFDLPPRLLQPTRLVWLSTRVSKQADLTLALRARRMCTTGDESEPR